jgi:HEAT repeat protein
MASAEYERLEKQLVSTGAVAHAVSTAHPFLEFEGPIAVLVNTRTSAAAYEDLLLAAVPVLRGNELEMVVRCLSQRGLKKAGPVFVRLMRELGDSANPGLLWVTGNALATIADPQTYRDVVTLCGDWRLGSARQMLFSLLPRIGTDAAYVAALAALDDETVRGHAIEAVGRFGRPEALPLLEALITKQGLYENRARATAIRRLERVKDRSTDA